jgi:exosome complex component RRP41
LNDRRIQELQTTISSTFQSALLTHLHPHSLITLTLHVLSTDGSLLATCLNACTLALVDAGIPMKDYVTAVTCGSTVGYSGDEEGQVGDPILDVNGSEEGDGVPFITVGCLGGPPATTSHTDTNGGEGGGHEPKVVVLVCETRMPMAALEGMVAVGVDGCGRVRGLLDEVVRGSGRRFLRGERG